MQRRLPTSGKHPLSLALTCRNGECSMIATVTSGEHRGLEIVLETFRSESSDMRDQCVSTLRMKFGDNEVLTEYIRERDRMPSAWTTFFSGGDFLRERLLDDYATWGERGGRR